MLQNSLKCLKKTSKCFVILEMCLIIPRMCTSKYLGDLPPRCNMIGLFALTLILFIDTELCVKQVNCGTKMLIIPDYELVWGK